MSLPEQLPPDPDAALIADHGRTLVTLASASIDHGVEQARALAVDPAEFAAALREDHATFVTLTRAGELRGCTGSPRAWRPLVLDVAENAFATAFEDNRFRPLERGELGDLDITVTLLSPPAPLPTASQAGLARALRPGVDGLILEGRSLILDGDDVQLPLQKLAKRLQEKGSAPLHLLERIPAQLEPALGVSQ